MGGAIATREICAGNSSRADTTPDRRFPKKNRGSLSVGFSLQERYGEGITTFTSFEVTLGVPRESIALAV